MSHVSNVSRTLYELHWLFSVEWHERMNAFDDLEKNEATIMMYFKVLSQHRPEWTEENQKTSWTAWVNLFTTKLPRIIKIIHYILDQTVTMCNNVPLSSYSYKEEIRKCWPQTINYPELNNPNLNFWFGAYSII